MTFCQRASYGWAGWRPHEISRRFQGRSSERQRRGQIGALTAAPGESGPVRRLRIDHLQLDVSAPDVAVAVRAMILTGGVHRPLCRAGSEQVKGRRLPVLDAVLPQSVRAITSGPRPRPKNKPPGPVNPGGAV